MGEEKGEITLSGVGTMTNETPPKQRAQMWQQFWRSAGGKSEMQRKPSRKRKRK